MALNLKTARTPSFQILLLLTITFFVAMCSLIHARAAILQKHTTALNIETTKLDPALAPDLVLDSPQNLTSLAENLARATHKSVIIIAPQSAILIDSLSKLKSQPGVGSTITWQHLQTILRSTGTIPVTFLHTNTLALIQGSVYPDAKNPSKSCSGAMLWRQFYDAYSLLSSSERLALVSPEGLVVPTEGVTVSEGIRELSPSLFDPSLSQPARVRLRLTTSLETSFPDAPTGLVSGYWHWSQARTSVPINFPNEIAVLPERTFRWSASPLEAINGLTSKQFITKLAKATGSQILLSDDVQWPNITSSGGQIAVQDFLTGLKIATVANIHYLASEKLLYIAPASDVHRFLSNSAVPSNEINAYRVLVTTAARADGSDFGPLLFGVLQFPTSDLSGLWTKPILSDIPPDAAIEQAQSVASNSHLTQELLTNGWLKTYSRSTIFSYPGLVLVGLREKKLPNRDGEWYVSSRNNLNIPRLCF